MARRIISLFLSVLLLLQGTAELWALERPKKTFYEKAGWLDHLSNTLRRVAQRGEAGAYNTYKNPNPSPRNAYESVNIHQANLTDLGLYRNSEIYRRAKQIRDAFVSETAQEEEAEETLTQEDLQEIRLAVAELMDLYRAQGTYYPIVTQSVLEVARQLLALQKQYQFFKPQDLPVLKDLYVRILSLPAQCAQGEGYRIFCEGRADALDGFALLAQSQEDAQLIAHVLKSDLQQPFISRELLTGTQALLVLGKEYLLESVLQKAIDEERESFWQKIDVFMTGWWIQKIQYQKGRYLGNITSLTVLPGMYGKADGNTWEEVARMLYNQGRPSPASARLLARYGLGSCQVDLNDWDKGKAVMTPQGRPVFASVQCKTLLPFLVGAIASGVQNGADEDLQKAAKQVLLSPASFVARLYFEHVMGDLSAETELRIDNMLYDVFEKDLKAAETRRQEALKHNRQIDQQIKELRDYAYEVMQHTHNPLYKEPGSVFPLETETRVQISTLNKQKVPVPDMPDGFLKRYDRNSQVYKRKETGQKIYTAVAEVSSMIDVGLGIYYALAIPGMAVKGVQWGMSLQRGLAAVRAGRVTADVRRLAALSARLKKIRSLNLSKVAQNTKKVFAQALSTLQQDPVYPTSGLTLAHASPNTNVPTVRVNPVSNKRAAAQPQSRYTAAQAGKVSQMTASNAPAHASAKTASPRVSADMLRQVRVASVKLPEQAGWSAAIDLPKVRLAAYATANEMQKIMARYPESMQNILSFLEKEPARIGSVLRDIRDYARMEKDMAFYQRLRADKGLSAENFPVLSSSLQIGISGAQGRLQLAEDCVKLLKKQMASLPEGSSVKKAALGKELKGALDIRDELAGPQALIWPKEGAASPAAIHHRLVTLEQSGTLSPLQQREVKTLLKEMMAPEIDGEQYALLQLRTLNVPFLQPSPNTLWIRGDGFSGVNMLTRKTPLGFPMDQMLESLPFPQIVPFFKRGKENVLFVNGHGYVAQNGSWKAVLRQARVGETRPAATFSAEKVIEAALQSQSPRTSVYVHSCQTGAIFQDLPKLFEKYPQAAQKTEWFTITAPLQPASSNPIPAVDLGVGVRERLLNKLLLQITDNGNGLAARAWVKGRDVYPLRASVQRLEREMASAPAAQQASLQTLHDDLELLLNIADATSSSELQQALFMFRARYPGHVKDWDRALFADALMQDGGSEFLWGLTHLKEDAVLNMAPFIKLEPKWVDYVADTARGMFGLLKEDSSAASLLSSSSARLRSLKTAQQHLQGAPELLAQVRHWQKEDATGWGKKLLSKTFVQDFPETVEKSRSFMKGLEDKWASRGVKTLADVHNDPALMRQLLPDLSDYALLERQTEAAEELTKLYNQQAGFEVWNTPSMEINPASVFSQAQRKELGRSYIKYLENLRNSQPAAWTASADREMARAIKWMDSFGPDFSLVWNTDFLPSGAVLRHQLDVLGRQKASFSPLQKKEYASLQRALYRKPILGRTPLLELQNRISFFPRLERTPNTIFLWGDDLTVSDVWDRKTLTGFFRPKLKQYTPFSEALRSFKPQEENVLLIHNHGGISRKGDWKGILVNGEEHPTVFVRAQEILQGLSKSKSIYNYIYINGCFSGKLIENVRKLQTDFASTVRRSDWFVTASVRQYSAPEVLPADFVSGTARQKLFGKMLLRMRYNGDALAGKALIEGKELYPLKESIAKLGRQIKKAAGEEKQSLISLRQDLILLKNVADAKTNHQLLLALRAMEQAHPGSVKNFKLWQPGSALLDEMSHRIPQSMCGPSGFCWGIDKAKNSNSAMDPFITLQPKWVDYVAQTAEEMFAKAGKAPKSVKPHFEAEAFRPAYSSQTAEYIMKHRSARAAGQNLEESFFRIPVQMPKAQEINWGKNISAAHKKELVAQYQALEQEFESIKKDMTTSLYYLRNRMNTLDAFQRKKLSNSLLDLRQKILIFQHENRINNPFQPAVDWLENAVEIVFPAQRGRVMAQPTFPRPDRVYNRREFFLRGSDGRSFKTPKQFASAAKKQQWLSQQRDMLPKGLRVAVLNDEPSVLANYKTWLAKDGLGADSKWSFYTKIDDFLKELDNGTQFDLILTDLNFADGGAHYFVSWMRAHGDIHTPVIASSSFADEVVDGARLMREGFDGYLSTRNLSLANGEENLLRALNNYFKYREKNNWIR